jgi:pyruvate dehydrogenase E2 component (dihydrolipoamide acetyltransferase)
MEFESFDEGSFIHWNSEGETAPVDSIGIIGDEGEDVTALIAAKSEPKKQKAKTENKEAPTTPEATKKKNNIYSACSNFTRESLLSPCPTETQ